MFFGLRSKISTASPIDIILFYSNHYGLISIAVAVLQPVVQVLHIISGFLELYNHGKFDQQEYYPLRGLERVS